MDAEKQGPALRNDEIGAGRQGPLDGPRAKPLARVRNLVSWALIGPHGLRCGWAVALFIILYKFFVPVVGTVVVTLDPALLDDPFSPAGMAVGELIPLLAMLGSWAILKRVEGRRLGEYNLAGSRRTSHFAQGVLGGFLAISALVGALALGGWIRITPSVEAMRAALEFGAIWAAAFLLVGLTEEGGFRCYLLSTLTRGINLWWALAAEAVICAYVAMERGGHGALGIYAFALLGLAPCAWLEWRRLPGAGFWQAAWVTSTLFGAIHIGNTGENWVGILAAAAMGLVLCLSVRVTGAAWWAIGCHSAWDWGETYFYGTADSGIVPRGHLLTATPAGSALWNGGADGPEGSVLALAVIVLLALGLVAIYGRRRANPLAY